jgi:lipopolysaccharide/colanic/teichoic acid biosynthesis glycosyltransferase
MKRIFDVVVSFVGLVVAAPILLPVMFLIWRQDGHSPFYIADRVGLNGMTFKMLKLRSMVKSADKTGVDSTAANDMRITAVGHFIRRYKLDELTQLWNVLIGDMSLVGPRPNVKRETDLYTVVERGLLAVRPGITDFASIVFSDEGEILEGQADPDIAYNQLIRPGKGYLGLFYIQKRSLLLDIQLCWLTAVAIVSKSRALQGVVQLLRSLKADQKLIILSERKTPLIPSPPPGGTKIVTSRNGDPSL